MRTLGVDLAAQAAKTALCIVEWSRDRATLAHLQAGADDDAIVERAQTCDAVGIDAPFGWPVPFIDFLGAGGGSSAASAPWTADRRNQLIFRLTDHRVRGVLGRWPLSVASDRIAIAALRCAGLLSRLNVVDRAGDGRVFEVYPALALGVWGFVSRGYKPRGPRPAPLAVDRSALAALVDALIRSCPWLHLSREQRELCERNDDAFDALIAALIGRAAVIGQTVAPSPEERVRASREGWIAIPKPGSLHRLLTG